MYIFLSRVSEYSRPVANKQEVDSRCDYDQGSVGFGIPDNAGCVFEVELTSAGNIDVSRRLVGSRVQVEGNHEGTAVIGSLDIGSTIVEGKVSVVERGGESVVDGDTVSLDGDSVHGADALGDGGSLIPRRRAKKNRRCLNNK